MDKICVSSKCKNRCSKHIENKEIKKEKTYSEGEFFKGCDKSE